jgi:hypothetical protein
MREWSSNRRLAIHLGVTLAVLSVFSMWTVPARGEDAKEKTRITKLEDLPRHTYTITMKPSELLINEEAFKKLMAERRKDLEEDLAAYEIEDKTTVQQYCSQLQTISFLSGDYAAMRGYLEKVRALEEKEAQRLMAGFAGLAYVETVEKKLDPSSDAFRAAFTENMAGRLASMPWDVVQDMVKQLHGNIQIVSENLLVGMIQSQLDPAVEKAGYMSGDQASQLISMKSAMTVAIPYKAEMTKALGDFIEAHRTEKTDIWPQRNVAFTGDEGYQPVLVGIWDSGVDAAVFEDRCYTNASEKPDGKDNDKNGFVDDVHGIAFDLANEKTLDLLYPLGQRESERAKLEDRIKGFMDISSSIDSPEAAEIKKQMSGLAQDEVKDYIEGLSLYGVHCHGTHVAGIAIDGNPYAKVLVARLSFDHRMIPQLETKERMEKLGKSFAETVKYFKQRGVRVVNMSWVLTLGEIEDNLQSNGVGKSAEDRAKMAKELFDIASKALYAALKSAPEILFVGGAGNSDNDVEFDQFVPPAFDLPNLLIAGAVDQAGEPTGFTSFGKTVAVYSNGFEVESCVPGGRRMKLSGTSMASPNVANLAAKLIARDPSLEPAEVIELIKTGADDMGKDDRRMLVIHPKKSVELLEKKLTGQG